MLWFVVFTLAALEGLDDPGSLALILLYAIVFVCLCAGYAAYCAWATVTGRDRSRRRRAALAGDRAAIPVARLAARPQGAPDVAAVPLVLSWPMRARLRLLSSNVDVWSGLLTSGLILVAAIVLSLPPNPLPFPMMAVAPFAIAFAWLRYTGGPLHILRRPRRLTATGDGILRVPVLGRSRFIPWGEMRLLEVTLITLKTWRGRDTDERWYTLYGADTVIRWSEPALALAAPAGAYADLLAVIAARTGLAPRTFDRGLAMHPAWQPDRLPRGVVAPAVQDGEAPPAYARERPAAYVLSMTRRRTWRGVHTTHLILLAVGLMLLAGGLAAALWIASQVSGAAVPINIARELNWLNVVTTSLLLVGGVIGFVFLLAVGAGLIRGARPAPEVWVRADASGLRLHTPGRDTALAWAEIASLQRAQLGRNTYFVASAADTRKRIMWWTQGTPTLPHDPWEVNAYLVSAEDLAVLAARRSGNPVEDLSLAPEQVP